MIDEQLFGAMDAAIGGANSLFALIYNIGLKAFPVGIVCTIIAIFVSKGNDKVVEKEVKAMIIMIILYALLLIFKTPSETAKVIGQSWGWNG